MNLGDITQRWEDANGTRYYTTDRGYLIQWNSGKDRIRVLHPDHPSTHEQFSVPDGYRKGNIEDVMSNMRHFGTTAEAGQCGN